MGIGKKQFHVMARAVVVASLALSAAAQSAPPTPACTAPASLAGFGVCDVDGELWAAGPQYKARFDAPGVEFTPALGSRAEHDLPLTLGTVAVQRGATSVWAGARPAPQRDGDLRVEYELQLGLVERWDVRRGGLELSLLLASPPAGQGDLVVRVAVETQLPAVETDDAVAFELAGVGGVRVGGVTGIDARGARATGAIRQLDAHTLELRLPAAFVDSAAWPLVLDPLISPILPVGTDPALDEDWADVAYEPTFDRWLVVFHKIYALGDTDVRAQLLTASGLPVPGGFFLVESATDTLASVPAVATVAATDRFVIVWQHKLGLFAPGDVLMRSIGAGNGSMSAAVAVASGPDNQVLPDVGGHDQDGVTRATVVWEAPIAGEPWFFLRTVDVPAAGNPVASGVVDDVSDGTQPAISKSSGKAMRHVIANRDPSPSFLPPGNDSVNVAAYDPNGHFLFNMLGWSGYGSALLTEPDVDCDGDVALLVWESAPLAQPALRSIVARRCTIGVYAPAGPVFTLADAAVSGKDNVRPSVAFSGNAFVVAWEREFAAGDHDIAVVSVDPVAPVVMEPLQFVDFETTNARHPSLASRRAEGGLADDTVLCVWEADDAGDSDVLAASVNPFMGQMLHLGGATPRGGIARVSAGVLPHPQFTHVLEEGISFGKTLVIANVLPAFLPLCTGQLVPHPTNAVLLALTLDETGRAELVTPVPDDPLLVGVTLFEQWVTTDPLTSPCGKKLQLSNGVAVTFE